MFIHVGLNFDDITKEWSESDTLQLTVIGLKIFVIWKSPNNAHQIEPQIEGAKFLTERNDIIRLHMRKKNILALIRLMSGSAVTIQELEEALTFGDKLYDVKIAT